MKTLTTHQAAKELDIDVSRVQKLCRAGRLGYSLPRHGYDWVITPEEIESYRKAGPVTPGPKKK